MENKGRKNAGGEERRAARGHKRSERKTGRMEVDGKGLRGCAAREWVNRGERADSQMRVRGREGTDPFEPFVCVLTPSYRLSSIYRINYRLTTCRRPARLARSKKA